MLDWLDEVDLVDVTEEYAEVLNNVEAEDIIIDGEEVGLGKADVVDV